MGAQVDDVARMELRSSERSLRSANVKNSNSRATQQARRQLSKWEEALARGYAQDVSEFRACAWDLKSKNPCRDLLNAMLTELSSTVIPVDRKVLSFFKCDYATAEINPESDKLVWKSQFLEEAICALQNNIIPS